jgi:hypothetical protein
LRLNASDPFNATPEDYEMAIITVRTNEDAATRSGTSGSGTSQTNRQKLAGNIANNATQALVFDDPPSLSLWPRRLICKMRWKKAPSRQKRRMRSLA